ncbi:MAG: LLM class F420-dependent oxidoreductase [Ardenticatenaceae bacterium]|nr:LLM class F420-dependent oxidoreductase [Anaerolineales bacterium]MCB8984056.1 LLM class F420-dependent oxidoreductase [Ardenticatenaceae bacterium]
MKIGLQIPKFTWPGGPSALAPKLTEIAQTAEDAGFYSIWVMDHFFQLPGLGQPEEPMLEGYSALTYLAAKTSRVKLGTLVTGVIYRQPGFLIKQVTNLDVLSGGRAYFGVGAAWFEQEANGLGFPFPPTKVRFEWLEETLLLAHQMWSDDTRPFNGQHFQLAEPICRPQPVSQPHPPIMIGGMGETKTLRFVAKYADACNLFARVGNDVLKHKLEVLEGHCEAVGRPYSDIEKTALTSAFLGVEKAEYNRTAAEIVETCRSLAELGIDQVIFNMPFNVHEITPLETFGREIVPIVADF